MKIENCKLKIVVCWLYPELMSTYGDRGNIICLTKRCQWRGIDVTVQDKLAGADLIFGGGAQDRQQEIVMRDLSGKKDQLQKMFDDGVPGLFVCGAPQLLGRPYLGIFDMETSFPGGPRLIGNLVGEISSHYNLEPRTFVGFENHGGRTYLGPGVKPFARVIKGFGNNGEDGTEGAVYKNCLATYSHGPFLPKNPAVADWLIKTALEVKYRKEVELKPLDDALEHQAHDFIVKKYGH
ncbi:MAG: cobalamin biosynthesis protein CobQ [Patescibacteria group bacterium]|nr:cobalamin biosynthesis protein CobQ [Patescibacteria group bacterium]MCL5432327.1 cobalamin biosynthesis protein CobQ [Patescibacteria group bacterium]